MNKLNSVYLCHFFAGLLSMAPAFADIEEKDNSKLPLGCYDTGYAYKLKTLRLFPGQNGTHQSMYFLFNTQNKPITLYQMRDEESSRSLYLNHVVNPRQWAVLSTGEELVKFICAVPTAKSSYGKIIDCADSIRVCEYTNVRYGLNNRGNYWIVSSNTRNGALREVVWYGIIPAQ